MRTVYHSADSRGHADHGWLNTYHTFSFATYQEYSRMNFGVLRVLNDDTVAPGMGFGRHPHDNMEIISIPLEGDLKHGDSMGNEGIIRKGEVQVMSAGTGIVHSEMNANEDRDVKFLQIWVFTKEIGLEPRYDQIKISDNSKPNDFQLIVSPDKDSEGAWIHQDAYFYLANFSKGFSKEYNLKNSGNGVYIFVIEGAAKVGEHILGKRDGLGAWETDSFVLEATADSEILLMEVPMEMPAYLR